MIVKSKQGNDTWEINTKDETDFTEAEPFLTLQGAMDKRGFGWGCTRVMITREDLKTLISGGVLVFSDGEYEHYLMMENVK